MPIKNKKVKLLYDTMYADGQYNGSEDDFDSWFHASGEQGYQNRKQVWKHFHDNGDDVGATYEEFASRLGLHAVRQKPGTKGVLGGMVPKWKQRIEDTKREVGIDSGAKAGEAKGRGTGGYKPTWQEEIAFNNTIQSAKNAISSARKQTERDIQSAQESMRDPFRQPDMNRALDDAIIARERERIENPDAARLREAYEERDRIEARYRERMAEIDKEQDSRPWWQRAMNAATEAYQADKMGGRADVGSGLPAYDTDPELITLRSAGRKNMETITMLEDARSGKTNSFWHSLGNELATGRPLSMGAKADMEDAQAIQRAAKHVDAINRKRATGEALTREEQTAETVLENWAWQTLTEQQHGDQYGAWSRAGKTTAGSLGFMMDFLLTPGAANLAKGVAKGVVQGGTRLLRDKASSLFAKYMLKTTGATLGSLAAGGMIGNTVGIGRTMSDAAGRMQGNVYFDKDGNYVFGHYEDDGKGGSLFVEGGDTTLDAIFGAERSAIAENGSEMLGEFIPGSKVILKGMEKVGLSKVSSALKALGGKGWYQTYSNMLEKIGFHGTPGEVLEEYGGMGLDAIMGGDEWKSLADKRTHLDILLGCVTTGALLNALRLARTGAQMAQYYRYKHKTNVADRTASERMGEDVWPALRERIDGADNESVTDVTLDIIDDNNLTNDQRMAVKNYAKNLQRMRGYSLGMMQGADGASEDVVSMNRSFTSGYGITDEAEGNKLKQQVDDLRSELMAGSDWERIKGRIDSDPMSLLAEMRENPSEWTDETKNTVTEYVNAQMSYDGMQQRKQDDAEIEHTAKTEHLRGFAQREDLGGDGMLHPAVLRGDGRKVYIVSGNVEMLPDGTSVNTQVSDKDILVRDKETGEIRWTTADDIDSLEEVSSVEDAVTAVEIVENAEKAAQQAEREEASVRNRPDEDTGAVSQKQRTLTDEERRGLTDEADRLEGDIWGKKTVAERAKSPAVRARLEQEVAKAQARLDEINKLLGRTVKEEAENDVVGGKNGKNGNAETPAAETQTTTAEMPAPATETKPKTSVKTGDKLYDAYEREQGTVDEKGGLVKSDVAEKSLSKMWRGTLHSLGRRLGRRIEILSREEMERRFGKDAEDINGFFGKKTNTIYLNDIVTGNDARMRAFVAGHEITHILKAENADLYKSFAEAVKKALGSRFQEIFDSTKKDYDNVYDSLGMERMTDDDIIEEICCDYAGSYLLTDAAAIRSLMESAGTDARSIARKVLDWISDRIAYLKTMVTKGLADANELSAMEDAKKIWEEMYRASAEKAETSASPGTSPSPSKGGEEGAEAEPRRTEKDGVEARFSLRNLDKMSDEELDKEYMQALSIKEKPARIEKLRKSSIVEISKNDYDGKYALDATSAQAWIKQNLRGEHTIEDTGEKILISRVGAEEVTSHNRYDEAHLKSISVIPRMLKNAIFIGEKENSKNNKKFDSYRYYAVGLKIDGEDYTAKIVIGVKQGKKYYDHRLTQLEKTKLIDLLNQPASDFTTAGNASLPPYFEVKDKQLSSLLQINPEEISSANEILQIITSEIERRNNSNSRVRFSVSSKEDKAYVDAVKSGDIATAMKMLREKALRTGGITPYIAPHGYGGSHAEIAKKLKTNEGNAVVRAVADMQKFVPGNAVLVPMPPHDGKVTDDTDTMILADALSVITGAPVSVALEGAPRESRYAQKMSGKKGLKADEMGFKKIADIPEGKIPIIIDNVVGSGETAKAAVNALGGGITLAYAKGTRSGATRGLKNATITYDDNGNLIPLSERFNKANEDIRFSIGKRKTRRDLEREQYAQRQWDRAHELAKDWIEKLKIGDVATVYDSVDDIPEGVKVYADKKGWYDEDAKKITIVMNNHNSPQDVLHTILREAVARHGMRELFGSHYDTFLDNVYNNASSWIRERIDAKEKDTRTATEEYLAELAENTDFERGTIASDGNSKLVHWFHSVKEAFLEMLNKLGLNGLYTNFTFTDNELRYMLWRSYKNLTEPGVRRNPWQVAEDIVLRQRLQMGDFAKTEGASEKAADGRNGMNGKTKDVSALEALYNKMKASRPDALFLFRNADGDYVCVGKDMAIINRVLRRGSNVNTILGEDLELVLPRLIQNGFRVGIVDAPDGRMAGEEDVKMYDGQGTAEPSLTENPDGEVRFSVGGNEMSNHIIDVKKKHNLKGGAIHQVTGGREDIDRLRGVVPESDFEAIIEGYENPDVKGVHLPNSHVIVLFSERIDDYDEGIEIWSHEQAHEFFDTLPKEDQERLGKMCFDWLRYNATETYQKVINEYDKDDWDTEACAYFISETVKWHGLDKFMSADFAGDKEIAKFADEYRKFIINERQGRKETSGDRLRQSENHDSSIKVDGRGNQGREDESKEKRAGHDGESGNGITSNPTSPKEDIRYSVNGIGAGFTERDRVLARDAYERMVGSGLSQFREAVQDSMLSLKQLYEAVLKAEASNVKTQNGQGTSARNRSDFRIEDVADFENAYLAENRMSSMSSSGQHRYYNRYMKPLLAEIHRLCEDNGGDRDTLGDYMLAKHGLERNLVLADRDAREAEAKGEDYNDALQKCRERDYAGLTALTGMDDLAAAEAEAQRMVDDYESSHYTNLLWSLVKDATEATLTKIYRSGQMSKETYDKVRGMFDYYIPLRGWDEKTSDEVYGYLTGHDGPLYGSVMKRAGGRRSKADDPIATIGMMADSAIMKGNRNLMKQRFLNFVLNHPSDAVSVSDLWLRYNDITDEWEPVFPDLDPNDTAADVDAKVKAFEQQMQQLSSSDPDHYKRSHDGVNVPYKVVNDNLREHQVIVERAGRRYVLTINGNPRAAQALNGLTNPDVEMGGVVGNLMGGAEWLNRQLSAFYTTRNPDFVASNFLRDMLYSNVMSWVKEDPAWAWRFNRTFFSRVRPDRLFILFSKWENGTLNHSDHLEHLFHQFMANGGETGYTNVKDLEGHKRTVTAELRRQGNSLRAAASELGHSFDHVNRTAENVARFSAFVTSMEMGRGVARSIWDAKEISVNFNKKGSGGKMLNATGQTLLGKLGGQIGGWGRVLYVFWNAGVQGMTNFGRALYRNPRKGLTMGASAFLLGALVSSLGKVFGGDDDDKDAYYNLPEYIRRTNIIFRAPWGKDWISIPLPIELRALYGLGELAGSVCTGGERYDSGELAWKIAGEMSQVLPLDLLEGGGGMWNLVPSAAKPVVEVLTNRSWTGLPIYRKNEYNEDDPNWTKAYSNANTWLVSMSRWINEATGGDDYKKGALSPNPAQIEYILSGYFGGAYSVIDKLVKMGETAVRSRDFDWRNMLVLNRVVKTGDERTEARRLTNEYFKYKDEWEEVKRLDGKYEQASADDSKYAKKLEELRGSNKYTRYQVFDAFDPILNAVHDAMDGADDKTMEGLKAAEVNLRREMIDLMHDFDDGKVSSVDEVVDETLKSEYNSGGQYTRKAAAKSIAKRLGGTDSYGSSDSDWGKEYERRRTYTDLAEDVLLLVEQNRAKEAGDEAREKTINAWREAIRKPAQGMEVRGGDTDVAARNSEIMERIRELRRMAMESLGMTGVDGNNGRNGNNVD